MFSDILEFIMLTFKTTSATSTKNIYILKHDIDVITFRDVLGAEFCTF